MFKSSARVVSLCTVAGLCVLGGCSATPQAQQANLTVVSETPAPATPRVNEAIAARMAQSALSYNGQAIQLGAGDRFGRQLHAHYAAAIQMREQNRMYAEVVTER